MRVRAITGALLLVGLAVYLKYFQDLSVNVRIFFGAGLAVGVIVWVLVLPVKPITRQSPSARIASAITAALAVGLVAITMWRGLELLRVDPAKTGEAPPVGFLIPGAPAKIDRGFALGLGMRVKRCGEHQHVRVTLVAVPTAEYWRDYRSKRRRSRVFKLGIPGTDLDHLSYGITDVLNAVTNPLDARPMQSDLVRIDENLHTSAQQSGSDLVHQNVERVHDMTVITGRIRSWGDIPWSVVARFKAQWLDDRGQGSCYVRLPTLAGDLTAFGTAQAAGHAFRGDSVPRGVPRCTDCDIMTSPRNKLSIFYRPHQETVHGNTTVVAADGGSVLGDESNPEPDAAVEGDATWTCSSNPRPNKPTQIAFSKAELRQQVASNCSGYAVVSQRDAGARRDATILMVGILIAVGLGLLIEAIMDWHRAEFPLEDKPRDEKRSSRPDAV